MTFWDVIGIWGPPLLIYGLGYDGLEANDELVGVYVHGMHACMHTWMAVMPPYVRAPLHGST